MSSIKSRARFAGIFYLLTGLTGAFNLLYIPAAFVVRGDATATARRITDAALTYRIVVLSGLLSSIFFILLVVTLYNLFKDVDRTHAIAMVIFVSVSVAVGVVNLINQIAPLILLSGANSLSVFTKPQLDTLTLGFIVDLVGLPFMALGEGAAVIWLLRGGKVQLLEPPPSQLS